MRHPFTTGNEKRPGNARTFRGMALQEIAAMPDQIIDIRDIADRWQSILPLLDDTAADDAAFCVDCEDLCDELGIEPTVDSLREYGDNEPTMIREDYFTEYAQELAEDIGAIGSDLAWPMYCIDWKRAARDLAMDYSLVRFAGDVYYVR